MDDLSLERLVLSCSDWTTLKGTEREDDLGEMLSQTRSLEVKPAACCIPPAWVPWWVERVKLGDPALATVLNFPYGNQGVEAVMRQAQTVQEADEWDLVFPHEKFRQGDSGQAKELLQSIRELAPSKTVKVILETGLGWERKTLFAAAELAIDEGARFLKTSTGKIAVGATPEAVQQLCEVIKGTGCGLKVSGGIRTLEVGLAYALQVVGALGASYLHPSTFRVGTSTLLHP